MEIERKELFDGHYRDKYGRLRNEKGQFVHEPNPVRDEEERKEIDEWFRYHWRNERLFRTQREGTYILAGLKRKWDDLEKELLIVLVILTVGGLIGRILEWIF